MSRLYIVNCTGQNREINYRLDFTVDDKGNRTDNRMVPYKRQTIPARQQQQLGGDLHIQQIEEIISQLEPLGAVAASEIKTAKAKGVVRLVFSLDRPVPLPICKDVFQHNIEELSDEGAQRRERLALAADTTLTNMVDKTPAKFEMEFEQVERDDDLPGHLAEGLRVSRQAPQAPPKKRAGSRR